MFAEDAHNEAMPTLAKYSNPLATPSSPIIGRDREAQMVKSSMRRPMVPNVVLLAPPGVGKTTLVRKVAQDDTDRDYVELDITAMRDGLGESEMAAVLKSVFDDAKHYRDIVGKELVMFIDEFHLVTQLSGAATQALKPLLADAGRNGIRLIAATTFEEYREYVDKDQALSERLQRISLPEPNHETTISIMRSFAQGAGVGGQFYDDHLFELTYEYTQRYVPRAAQPRKSLLVIDSMIGKHLDRGVPMSHELLAEVMAEMHSVNVAFRIDATKVKAELDKKIIAQDFATSAVERRLQICVADLHDKSRPMASFLFTGSTGVGKSELTLQLARILFGDARRKLIRFDMTEFTDPSSVHRFRSELSDRVWEESESVLMIDEVEKAHRDVQLLLMNVLDAGRLSDDRGRQVSFLNTYIVMTTNAGSEVYKIVAQYAVDNTGSGEVLSAMESTIRGSLLADGFPAELLGRVNTIVPFQPLSYEAQRNIVFAKMKALRNDLYRRFGIKSEFDARVLDYLIGDKVESDSDAGGARNAIRRLNDEVVTNIARYVNEDPGVKALVVDVEGTMRYGNKDQLKSNAKIVVAPPRTMV